MKSKKNIKIFHFSENSERVFDCPGFDREFARKVFDNCQVFQHRNFELFFLETTLRAARVRPRWEYVVYDEKGSITASMAIYQEYDMHVGQCLSVLLAFSTDPHDLIGGYRFLFKKAKELDIPFVSYTKEIRPYEYSLVYRRVK